MRNWTMSGLLVVGALVAGCGGTEALEEPAANTETPALGESQAGLEYNEDLHCIVMTSSIRCNNGRVMYSYWSAELGHYFISRYACGSSGPVVCPL
ncbi:hypothetical protein LZ198_25815 [Myxococcus sp. K15C18031901]|uniref:hypothetical protein n=1 Tax=Myxococcus dinghuensis TaxID=2906761 RepID=UPI0020A7E3EF|nr:hypothetical protein [Myxococcus dinghuensis]MCP3102292.1 hypothetical protein [Myxococcus dinghuensis]